MLNPFFSSHSRWYTPLLSFSIALGIGASTPEVTLATPWLDILRQGVQVYQLYNVFDKEEVRLGQQINQQLVGEEFQLYNNVRVNSYVDRIGQRLAKNSTRPDIAYTFQVVKDDSINAFATAGGYVYVTTGLLQAADNEAQLAGVLAHEIGHIAERHLIESTGRLRRARRKPSPCQHFLHFYWPLRQTQCHCRCPILP